MEPSGAAAATDSNLAGERNNNVASNENANQIKTE